MIEQLLRKHDFRPDTLQDQHFLDDEQLLDREVDEAELSQDDTVLEIGSGPGTLTKRLADQAGQVHTIEQDERLIRILEKELRMYDNIEVIHGDAMQVDWPDFDACVSNPPYHISSDLVRRLGPLGNRSILSLQRSFAQKLIAEPGSSDYSPISVTAQYYFIPVYLQDIPPESFYPDPDVPSALVRLYPREKQFGVQDDEQFLTTVKALFTHKRKKVRNALVDARHILDISKQQAQDIRDSIPHSQARVNTLNIRQLAEISIDLREKL